MRIEVEKEEKFEPVSLIMETKREAALVRAVLNYTPISALFDHELGTEVVYHSAFRLMMRGKAVANGLRRSPRQVNCSGAAGPAFRMALGHFPGQC